MFRPDTSFPYLALARRAGVDYGHVLRLSDTLARSVIIDLVKSPPLTTAVYDVLRAEERRRATIRHNAMHTGEAP
jgi:hypothetical protein